MEQKKSNKPLKEDNLTAAWSESQKIEKMKII